MVWRVVAENDPREKDLHVGVTRGNSPGDVTTIVATRGKVLSHFQEPHSAVFAGSDDGFIAQYDDRLNFIKDWHAQAWLHGLQQFFVAKATQVFTAICNSVSLSVTHFVSHGWL